MTTVRRLVTTVLPAALIPVAAALLALLHRAAVRLFGLRVDVSPPLRPAEGPAQGPPLLVLSRHAGPGDSFLVVHSLLAGAGLRPHIVLKSLLRLDPCLDVLLGRVPHYFVPRRRGDDAARGMARLAAGLAPGDALVVFPEGGNFTERRHRRAVAALRRAGRRGRAARAAAMEHVLAPRTTGVFALLDAADGVRREPAGRLGADTRRCPSAGRTRG